MKKLFLLAFCVVVFVNGVSNVGASVITSHNIKQAEIIG